jgi:hypothetical protein
MLQQLAQSNTNETLVIVVMFLAIIAFGMIALLAFRAKPSHCETMAHMPLDDETVITDANR